MSKRAYVTVRASITLNGHFVSGKLQWGRASETYVFDLDSLAHMVMWMEASFMRGSTKLDYAIESFRDKFPNDKTTTEELMDKYWYKNKETMNEDFKALNGGDPDNILYKLPYEYLQQEVFNALENVREMPEELRNAFLHGLVRHLGGVEAIQKSADSVSKAAKDAVDELFIKEETK